MNLKRLNNWILARRRYKDLPKDPWGSDLYLVEFPKSGITWFSTILANCFLIRSESPQRATYFNVGQYVSDIHMTGKDVGPPLLKSPGFRVIKSHAEYCPRYLHVVYLVRHPAQVLRSYRTFLAEHGNVFETESQFLHNKRYGIPAWRRHVRSWLTSKNQAARLYVIRYEDIVEDSLGEIRHLNDVLGLGLSEDIITSAISLASSEEMGRSHAAYSERNPRYKLSFVKGSRTDLSEDGISLIENQCREELTMLGY